MRTCVRLRTLVHSTCTLRCYVHLRSRSSFWRAERPSSEVKTFPLLCALHSFLSLLRAHPPPRPTMLRRIPNGFVSEFQQATLRDHRVWHIVFIFSFCFLVRTMIFTRRILIHGMQ